MQIKNLSRAGDTQEKKKQSKTSYVFAVLVTLKKAQKIWKTQINTEVIDVKYTKRAHNYIESTYVHHGALGNHKSPRDHRALI